MFFLGTILTPLFLVLAELELNTLETISGMKQELIDLQQKASEQEKELEALRISMRCMKNSKPSVGVLGLLETDGSLGEVSSKGHDEKFTHITTISVNVPVRDRKDLPKNKRPNSNIQVHRKSEQAVVTINTQQELQLWDAEQNELATLSLGFTARATALVAPFSTGEEPSFVAIGFSDGNVFRYVISIWRSWNKFSLSFSLRGSIMRIAHPVLAPPPDEPSKGEQSEKVVEETSPVSALGLISQTSVVKVLVGYEDGWLRSFRVNGQMKKERKTGNDSIVTIGFGEESTLLAIFTDSGFHLYKGGGLKPWGDFCRYKEGTSFIDYAFDQSSKAYLYVGYSDGSISAYGTKKTKNGTQCNPIHELSVESGVPMHLETTDGYLLASSPTSLYIFNTSDISRKNPPNLLETNAMVESFSGLSPVALSSTRDWYHHTLVVAAEVFTIALESEECTTESCKEDVDTGSTMVIYESHQKTKRKSKMMGDFNLMDFFNRTTALVLATICVFVWQFILKKNSPFSKMFGKREKGKKAGRKRSFEPGSGFDMLDMQKREMMRMHGAIQEDSDSSG